MKNNNDVYTTVTTGRSVELKSEDQEHERKMATDENYRKAYIQWCYETNR